MASLANALQEVRHPIQVAVVCGKNTELTRRLEELPAPNHPVKPVGPPERGRRRRVPGLQGDPLTKGPLEALP